MQITELKNSEQAKESKKASVYSRTNPFHAKVLKNYNLNGAGSSKETRHIEFSLEGSGLTYGPGDALGVIPKNDPELVDAIIKEMNWNAEEAVVINKQGDTLPLKEALTTYFDITSLSRKHVQQAAGFSENKELQALVLPENDSQLKEYIDGRDLLDLLTDFGPWKASAQEIVSMLRKLAPRLYSIASSITAHPNEVHLTIGAVRYTTHGRERKGVCSVLVAERTQEGDTIPVFIQPNKHFQLPEEKDTNIIMVGPGTGIAPFRSFIEERSVDGTTGKSWLFFGDQHAASDFLYQEELENYQNSGVLTKLDLAFSRDTEKKVYVQNKMLENAKELFEWLEAGAHFYVCGDKQRMAKDVHDTLVTIIEKEGAMSREAAEEYLNDLKKQKRYQRDVY